MSKAIDLIGSVGKQSSKAAEPTGAKGKGGSGTDTNTASAGGGASSPQPSKDGLPTLGSG